MKQKNLKLVQYVFLVIFMATAFSQFLLIANAQNGCSYSISFGEANNTTTAVPGQTLNFQATATESGNASSCSSQVSIWLGVSNSPSSPNSESSVPNAIQSMRVQNFTTDTVVFPYTVPSGITQFSVRAHVNNSSNQNVATSSWWNVSVTGGSSGGSGSATINFSPAKSSFNSGDSVGIHVSMSSAAYSQAQSQGVQNVFFNLLINGQGGYDETTLPLSAFAGQAFTNYGTIDITSANGFKNGSNSVSVELWAAGTSVKLATTPATNLNVAGIGAANPPNQGTGNPTNQGTPNPPNQGTGNPTTSNNPTDKLYNPLPEDNLTSTLLLIAKGFLGVVAIWASVFIIIGGFELTMAAGSEEMVLKGRKTITWAILGLVAALLSFSIIAIVQNIFQANIQPVKSGMVNSSKVAYYK